MLTMKNYHYSSLPSLPSVICLQETLLKDKNTISIKNYTSYNYTHTRNQRASGGTSIIINNKIPQKQINLNTPLQTIAVSVSLHKNIKSNLKPNNYAFYLNERQASE